MSSEAFIEMLRTDRLTEEHVRQLDRLIADHPWFGPARFLRLKGLYQLGKVADKQETGLAAVLSGDRSHLYRYIHGEVESLSGMSGSDSTELEFITDDEGVQGEMGNLLMPDDEAASEKSIPEKEDDEMEEPEIDEAAAVPVSDPLDIDGDEDVEDGQGEAGSVPFIDQPDDEIYEEGDAGIEEADSVPVSDLPIDEEGEPGTREEGALPFDELPDDEVGELGAAGTGDESSRQEHSEHSDSGQPDQLVTEQRDQQERGHPDQQKSEQRDQQVPGQRVRPVDPVQPGASNGNSSNQSIGLIEQFLNSEPGVIKADKQTSLEGDVSERSVKEDDSFITNTLAKIYVKQGLHAKAIYAYERLSLKYPEKSAYFAAQIEKIKNNTNI